VALVFGLPEIVAFSSQGDPAGAQTIRPIATFLETPSDRVEIYFTAANNTLWIDVYSRGFLIQKLIFPQIYLDKQDKVNLVIASNDVEFGATLQVMRDGYPITHQIQTSNGSIKPTRILLSNRNRTVVTPLEWYAIQVNESEALDANERAAFLVSDRMFRILDTGGRPGDMDLNGFVDFDDIDDFGLALNDPALYQATFTVPGSLHGDADGDGDLDVDDIDEMIAIFSVIPTPGDMDVDGDVDFDDIDEFVQGLTFPAAYEDLFGIPPDRNGDLDRDRDLDFDDIDNFVALLGASSSAVAQATATVLRNDPIDVDTFAQGFMSNQRWTPRLVVGQGYLCDLDGDRDQDFDDIDELLSLLALNAARI
jgi:hypothetical protein